MKRRRRFLMPIYWMKWTKALVLFFNGEGLKRVTLDYVFSYPKR